MAIRSKSLRASAVAVCSVGSFALLAACGSFIPGEPGADEKADTTDSKQDVALVGSQELTLSFGDLAGIAGAEQGKAQAASTPAARLSLQDAAGAESASVPSSTSPTDPGSSGVSVSSDPLPEVAAAAPLSTEELEALEKQRASEEHKAGIQLIEVELILEGQRVATGKIELSRQSSITLTKLPIGAYEIKVRMLDSAGTVVMQGSGKADVKAGERNVARLRMRPDEKSGSLTIVVDGEEKPRPLPALQQRGRFINVFSPFLSLEMRALQAIPNCGERRVSLQWLPGRADIEVQRCADGRPVIEGFVIDRAEGIAVLRDFLDGMRREVKLREELGAALDPLACNAGGIVYSLRAKFEDEKKQGVSKHYVAPPECFAGAGGSGAFDGVLPPPAMERMMLEVAKLSGFVGKQVYARRPDFGSIAPLPGPVPMPGVAIGEPFPGMPAPQPQPGVGAPVPTPVPAPSAQDIEALRQRKADLRVRMASLIRRECNEAYHCRPFGIGALPCGGSDSFLPMSELSTTQKDQLTVLQFDERRVSEALNRYTGKLCTQPDPLFAPVSVYCDKTVGLCKLK